MNNSYWYFLNKNEKLYWKGFCSKDRNIAIYEFENIINQHGSITDFHMFSDIEISIRIEAEERNIQKLYADLKNYITLNDFEDLISESHEERIVLLQITFTRATGNLRIEVLPVPG
jgi:hypothetical protein